MSRIFGPFLPNYLQCITPETMMDVTLVWLVMLEEGVDPILHCPVENFDWWSVGKYVPVHHIFHYIDQGPYLLQKRTGRKRIIYMIVLSDTITCIKLFYIIVSPCFLEWPMTKLTCGTIFTASIFSN